MCVDCVVMRVTFTILLLCKLCVYVASTSEEEFLAEVAKHNGQNVMIPDKPIEVSNIYATAKLLKKQALIAVQMREIPPTDKPHDKPEDEEAPPAEVFRASARNVEIQHGAIGRYRTNKRYVHEVEGDAENESMLQKADAHKKAALSALQIADEAAAHKKAALRALQTVDEAYAHKKAALRSLQTADEIHRKRATEKPMGLPQKSHLQGKKSQKLIELMEKISRATVKRMKTMKV